MGKFVTIHDPENETVSVDAMGSISTQTQMLPGIQPLYVQQGPVQGTFSPSAQIAELERLNLQPETVKIEIIEKIVYVDRPITLYETKEVEVIKEVPVYQDRIVEKIVEVDKPTIHIRDVYHDRVVEIPRITVQKKVPDWAWAVMSIEAVIIAMSVLLKLV